MGAMHPVVGLSRNPSVTNPVGHVPAPYFTYDGLAWCAAQGGELRASAIEVARRDYPRSALARAL